MAQAVTSFAQKSFDMSYLKRVLFIFSVAILVTNNVSCSNSENERDTRYFESQINQTLEAIKEFIKEGSEALGIPPLDPLNIGHLNFPVFINEIIYVDIEASDISVSGISGFYAKDLKFNILTWKLDYTILVPKIVVGGLYGLNGTLIQFIPAFGNGDFGAEITNLELSGHIQLSLASSVKDFQLIISLDDVQLSLTGLMDNEEFTQSLINTLNEYVGPIINQFKEEISQVVSPIIKYIINSILKFILHG